MSVGVFRIHKVFLPAILVLFSITMNTALDNQQQNYTELSIPTTTEKELSEPKDPATHENKPWKEYETDDSNSAVLDDEYDSEESQTEANITTTTEEVHWIEPNDDFTPSYIWKPWDRQSLIDDSAALDDQHGENKNHTDDSTTVDDQYGEDNNHTDNPILDDQYGAENSHTDDPMLDDQHETDKNDTENSTMSRDPNNVAFYLYPNAEHLNYSEQIKIWDRQSLDDSSYNSSNPVIFIIHGFISNYTSPSSATIKNAFLQNGYTSSQNIIVLDWGKLSTPANFVSDKIHYQAAVDNVPRVGKRVSQFIYFLMAENFLSGTSEVYIVGFSLGAHVAGVTGYFVKQNKTSNCVHRITGIDPAGPLYQNEMTMDKKLDSSDAFFVDAIHTNQGQDGYYGSLGHADFYPNGGGPNQPGCQDSNVGNTVPDTVTGSCSHSRVYQFYSRSISEKMYACKCMSNADPVACRQFCTQKVPFGWPCPTSARGSYYLDIA